MALIGNLLKQVLKTCESVCFQRYSVAVYLVRVFTAADLFSQLKLCSVESAERCRERSKYLYANGIKTTHCDFHFASRSLLLWHVMIFCLLFIFSPRQTTFWPREWNCDHRPPGFSHLSSEYTCVIIPDVFRCGSVFTVLHIFCFSCPAVSKASFLKVCHTFKLHYLNMLLPLPRPSWWRCGSVCHVEF